MKSKDIGACCNSMKVKRLPDFQHRIPMDVLLLSKTGNQFARANILTKDDVQAIVETEMEVNSSPDFLIFLRKKEEARSRECSLLHKGANTSHFLRIPEIDWS